MKKLLTLFLCFTLVLMQTGCIFEDDEDEKEEIDPYAIIANTKDTLKDNTYYIKHGEEFYEIGVYEPSFKDDRDNDHEYTIKLEKDFPDPMGDKSRTYLYEKDKSELLIPTMYADDELIYKTSQTISGDIEWERFADGGYTFPVRGLKLNSFNKATFKNYYFNIPEESETAKVIKPAQGGLTEETDEDGKDLLREFTLNAIDGTAVTAEMLTDYGTVKDPKFLFEKGYDDEFTLDFYKGTKLMQVKTKANWRIFYNFEDYWTNEFEYSDNGYLIIKIGKAFKTGYYKTGTSGLFRYVAKPYSDSLDITALKYNVAYFKHYIDEETGKEKYEYEFDEELGRFIYKDDEELTSKDTVEKTELDENKAGDVTLPSSTPVPAQTPEPTKTSESTENPGG